MSCNIDLEEVRRRRLSRLEVDSDVPAGLPITLPVVPSSALQDEIGGGGTSAPAASHSPSSLQRSANVAVTAPSALDSPLVIHDSSTVTITGGVFTISMCAEELRRLLLDSPASSVDMRVTLPAGTRPGEDRVVRPTGCTVLTTPSTSTTTGTGPHSSATAVAAPASSVGGTSFGEGPLQHASSRTVTPTSASLARPPLREFSFLDSPPQENTSPDWDNFMEESSFRRSPPPQFPNPSHRSQRSSYGLSCDGNFTEYAASGMTCTSAARNSFLKQWPSTSAAGSKRKLEPKRRGRPPKAKKEQEGRLICSICREVAQGKCMNTRCGHFFHEQCLTRWTNTSGRENRFTKTCPAYGSHFIMDEVNPIFF